MTTTIKQRVTVEPGGRVALQSPELHEGECAELTVIVERAEHSHKSDERRLGALDQLRKALNLSEAAVQLWEADIHAERNASRVPPVER